MIPFSILDLSPIVEGGDAAQALRNTIDLAQHAEQWGYHRYWLAEHHNIPSVASAATAVVICGSGRQHVDACASARAASCCRTTRRSSLQSSSARSSRSSRDESISRWAARRDRDQITARALRRQPGDADTFPQDVLELIDVLPGTRRATACRRSPAPA